MKTKMDFRILIMLSFFLLIPILTQAQTANNASELKNLEAGIATAKAKVTLNERKVAVADSLIESGNKLIAESKAETKTIDAEKKKLEKDYAAKQKPLTRLSTSKDKAEAVKARADLKALDLQYRTDAKALDARLRDSAKKLTKGNSNLTKGKAARKSAQDALKISQSALKVAQGKYDAVYFSGGNTNPNKKVIK